MLFAGDIGLAPGAFHTLLVQQDGSVWSTGVNLGDSSKRFVKVIEQDATAAAAGNYYSIILEQDGSVMAAGENSKGQLGDGTTASRSSFDFVTQIPGAKAVAAGVYHSMVLTQEGHVRITGWNRFGQLGVASTPYITRFFSVISNGAKAVAAGDMHSIVLKED